MTKILGFLAVALMIFCAAAGAQQSAPAPAQQGNQSIYKVTVVGKTVTAVSYQHRSGSTMIGFQGTPLLPLAKGDAKVDSKQGSIVVSASFRNMQSAQKFGKEYLTYVLWAITPEGKPNNLGELLLDGDKSKLTATTNLQTFGMIVTAEPYFAVNMPSDVVVLENVVRADTVGTAEQVTANYELMQRGTYTYDMSKAREPITDFSPKVPLEIYEARNAVSIAQSAGADSLAPDAFQQAVSSLGNADNLLAKKASRKEVIAAARDAVQTAADARAIALQRAAQQKAAAQQAASQEAAARAEAEKQALRAALLDQFNRVLPTTDTPRGLQVNMADVLFAFGKYELQPPAREALAKFSGIVLAHPGLHLAVEGYTDSVGSDAFNQTLSEQRASTVRAYLITQGLDPNSITATGFGKSNPVASNDTPAGRQQNRRVEIIISGEVIGTKIGSTSAPQQ